MARSEFRWNKKRRHYAYLHKDVGSKRKNILITTKPYMVEKKNKNKQRITKNIPLFRHPNINKTGQFYLVPKNYEDDVKSFEDKVYNWEWDRNDKRKVKRIKKEKAF